MVLYLSLLDDATIARIPPGLGVPRLDPAPPRAVPPRWRRAALGAIATTMAILSAYTFVREIRRPDPMPEWSAAAFGWIAPFRSVSGYGLFRTMTIERPEIVIEGSADGAPGSSTRSRGRRATRGGRRASCSRTCRASTGRCGSRHSARARKRTGSFRWRATC